MRLPAESIKICLLALLVAAGATGAAVVDASPSDHRAGSGRGGFSQRQAAPVDRVPDRQTTRFAQLRRGRNGDDPLPAPVREQVAGDPDLATQWGINANLSRRTSRGGWLVPGDGALCAVQANAGDGSYGLVCNTEERVLDMGLVAWDFQRGAASGLVSGVVPDGVEEVTLVDRSGGSRTIPVRGNSFDVAFDGTTDRLTFTGRDGQLKSQPRPSQPVMP